MVQYDFNEVYVENTKIDEFCCKYWFLFNILENQTYFPKVFSNFECMIKTTPLSWQNYVQGFNKMCVREKADRIYEEIVLVGMMQTTFVPGILLQNPDKWRHK